MVYKNTQNIQSSEFFKYINNETNAYLNFVSLVAF